MSKSDQYRRDQLREIIQSGQARASQLVAESGLKERRREALESNSDYQRRKRLGADGRMREAVDILAKNIHERNHHGEALPSFDMAQREAARKAEKLKRKMDED